MADIKSETKVSSTKKTKSSSPLKVLFVSAEVAPYSSVGGLSQVSYFLPQALLEMGVDVRIFTPKYGTLKEELLPQKLIVEGLKVPTEEKKEDGNPTQLICNVKSFNQGSKKTPIVYFLENMEYFEKRANVYNYSDDHIRFGLLSRGALEFIKQQHFVPDIIHCNDWHTSYLINFLKHDYQSDDIFKKITTVLSIHNTYQGLFDFHNASDLDFDDGKGGLAPFFSERFFKQNALKRGIINSDIINTVSETYARELLTVEYGGGLHNLFKELRGKLFGILNGLDYKEFNPQTDKLIKQNYSFKNLKKRADNKTDLQKEFNLKVSPDTPLLAFYGRLDKQKGIDLIVDVIEFLLSEFGIQFIAVGSADPQYKDFFLNLEKKYPHQVGTHLMFNALLPRKIISGADMLLMPSKYEPGGIVAIEAMRYGCIPIVRATGGLADSVTNFNSQTNQGTGFTFQSFSTLSFLANIVRALEIYQNPKVWTKIQHQAMKLDFSWQKAAEKYLDLYLRAIDFHTEAQSPNPPLAFRNSS